MAVIFEVLGTPEEQDIAFVTDSKATTYLKSFTATPRQDLGKKYPGASAESLDLLNQMLQINPFFRITVDAALDHPCFLKIRKQSKEMKAEHPVMIDFEEMVLDSKMLRQVFLKLCAEIQADPTLRK